MVRGIGPERTPDDLVYLGIILKCTECLLRMQINIELTAAFKELPRKRGTANVFCNVMPSAASLEI